MSEKRKTRRQNVKNPSLKARYNSKIRQEYIDMDYIDKLSDDEKAWMNDFMSEWNNASVGKQAEAEQNRFHKTAKEVKECTDRNNARNVDIYGVAKAKGMISKLDFEATQEIIEKKQQIGSNFTEDSMIDMLDNHRESEERRLEELESEESDD